MHHQSKFNPDVSLIKFSSIWREIRLAIVLPAVKYSLQPICFQVKPIQVRWNQANDNGTMRVKKETRTCSIQLREHNIDDNGSMCVCVCRHAIYLPQIRVCQIVYGLLVHVGLFESSIFPFPKCLV